MNRNLLLSLVALLAGASSVFGAETKPNILLFLTDDLGDGSCIILDAPAPFAEEEWAVSGAN